MRKLRATLVSYEHTLHRNDAFGLLDADDVLDIADDDAGACCDTGCTFDG